MTDEVLKCETRDHVRILTLNRPAVRNAIDAAMGEALAEALLEADNDPEVYVVALTGAGSAFCSGADLKVASDMVKAGKSFRGPLHTAQRVFGEIMIDAKKPSIAIINGPAVAGGFELALACDMMVAADTAFFAVPEAKRGRGAHYASVLLPQTVPPAIAMEWLYTGRRVSLEEAVQWGLVNRVFPAETLMEDAMKFISDITSSSTLSLQRMKMTYRKTHGMSLHSALRLDAGPDVYASEDQKEGARAYVEKRDPKWTGR